MSFPIRRQCQNCSKWYSVYHHTDTYYRDKDFPFKFDIYDYCSISCQLRADRDRRSRQKKLKRDLFQF
jgi:hypothetical protein